jgi:DNA repair exonuclease SbcCD ATPase subunit
MTLLTETRSKLDKHLIALEAASLSLQKDKQAAKESSADVMFAETAQVILQNISTTIQEQAHSKIGNVVSRCLETVFDDPYEFEITFERKRGKTEAVLSFVRDGNHVHPMSASGGGVVDVAAFALRLACLVLSIPHKRRTLILDEPFKFVSKNYRHRVRQMMETLSREMDVQFIMVTHIPELECGKVVKIQPKEISK